MRPVRALESWKQALVGMLGIAARPVRAAQGWAGVVIEPYRGYGSKDEVFLIGRVFRQSKPDPEGELGVVRTHLKNISRRLVRRAVPDARVAVRFYGAEAEVRTDRDGYFRVHLSPQDRPPSDRSWHAMDLTLIQPEEVRAQAQIFIPPPACRYVVISDIDDTIMKTGVANKLKMLWRLFVQEAESRAAFPGVGALYRALHRGTTGDQQNPMLYVSRAPWGIYAVLEDFFNRHGIPVGPVLFLREWGISWKSPLPRKAERHKHELIQNMLALYGDLPFVLIGDSGQHDPEVYRQIVEQEPGRVRAVYIRNVSRSTTRIREIEDLARAVAGAGSTLLLAADSVAMAEHAVKLGLVSPETVAEVRSEKAAEGAAPTQPDTLRVKHSTPGRTVEAVTGGELKDALQTGGGTVPPNVVVEPGGIKRPHEAGK